MVINVHAGHNPDGKIACGAAKYIKESTEARAVKDLVISKLRALDHTVYDCTVDDGISQSDVLSKIVKKENLHKTDLDISIHFNAGGGEGVEVFCYNEKSEAIPTATRICDQISKLGYKNRGVKFRSSLFVLRYSKNPSLLIECCFVDSKTDTNRYNAEAMATAIVNGVIASSVKDDIIYKVQLGAFANKENALKLIQELTTKGYSPVIVESRR